VGVGAVFIIGRTERADIRLVVLLDAGHSARRVVLAAKDGAVFVLSAQGSRANVLFAKEEGGAGAVQNVRQLQRSAPTRNRHTHGIHRSGLRAMDDGAVSGSVVYAGDRAITRIVVA